MTSSNIQPSRPRRAGNMDQLYPRRRDADGHYLCRFCGGSVPAGRRWWCSDKCVDEAKVRCWPAHAAEMCFKRDQTACQKCHAVDPRRAYREGSITLSEWKANRDFLKLEGYDIRRSIIEAHHIKPVKDGGGSCGLDNLVTLCQLCHNKTKGKANAE